MLPQLLRHLRCPVCRGELTEARAGTARSLRCAARHSFDVAREGYVHLGGPRMPHAGDTADMIAARANFLARGHYDFIARALAGQAATAAMDVEDALIVDAGAGPGHQLAAVLDARRGAFGLALDASRFAVRRAARGHPRMGAVLCDTTRPLPLADASASVLLNVFAPRNGAEFRRVLREDGVLVVVTPANAHLHQLVRALGLISVDPAKEERLERSLGAWFAAVEQVRLARELRLGRSDARALVAMGPSARHVDPADLDERLALLDEPIHVTAAVRVARYQPRKAGSAGRAGTDPVFAGSDSVAGGTVGPQHQPDQRRPASPCTPAPAPSRTRGEG